MVKQVLQKNVTYCCLFSGQSFFRSIDVTPLHVYLLTLYTVSRLEIDHLIHVKRVITAGNRRIRTKCPPTKYRQNTTCSSSMQRRPWVHFSKSNPSQCTSLLTQSNPIHHNCEYFDTHTIQSSAHCIGENIIRYVSKFDFICAVNAACW